MSEAALSAESKPVDVPMVDYSVELRQAAIDEALRDPVWPSVLMMIMTR